MKRYAESVSYFSDFYVAEERAPIKYNLYLLQPDTSYRDNNRQVSAFVIRSYFS